MVAMGIVLVGFLGGSVFQAQKSEKEDKMEKILLNKKHTQAQMNKSKTVSFEDVDIKDIAEGKAPWKNMMYGEPLDNVVTYVSKGKKSQDKPAVIGGGFWSKTLSEPPVTNLSKKFQNILPFVNKGKKSR